MRPGFFLGCLCLFLSLAAPAAAAEMLGALMRDAQGAMSTHVQTATEEQCNTVLELFRTKRAAGGELELTMRDPDFTGIVVMPFCVHPDGTAIGPDGPIKLK